MLWRIKKGIHKQKIIDTNGAFSGSIIRKGTGFEIKNTEGHCVMRVERNAPLNFSVLGEGTEGRAEITLEQATSFIKPPRAASITFTIGDSSLYIRQTPTRNFTVSRAGEELAWITGIPCHPQVLLATHSSFDFVGLLYVLALFMYHEDDIDIV